MMPHEMGKLINQLRDELQPLCPEHQSLRERIVRVLMPELTKEQGKLEALAVFAYTCGIITASRGCEILGCNMSYFTQISADPEKSNG